MDTFQGPRCIRCRRTRHLILADGPPVCRVCTYGWGALARIVAGPDPDVAEPSSIELLHRLRHTAPVLDCVFCRQTALLGGST